MITAMERLRNMRVEQVMATDVISIHEGSTMYEAAKLMHDCGITGAPVVDDYGRCVGVLSASDFVESKIEQNCGCVTHVATTYDRSGLTREVLDNECVRAHMSPKIQTIREHRSIVDAGQLMCEEHIHRLLVVDRQNRPVGIVTSLDLVSALVHAPAD
jgi:CBS domain-containing protein